MKYTLSSDWPGIDPKWTAGRKTYFKRQSKWFDGFYPQIREVLDHFATTGRRIQRFPYDQAFPGYRQWEEYLDGTLLSYSFLKEFEFVTAAERDHAFDTAAASSIFAAARLSELIMLHIHIRSPDRLGAQISSMSIETMPQVAMGVVIGDPRALPLVQLLVTASRRGWYVHDHRFPIYTFMLLLLAAFLQEPLTRAMTAFLGSSPLVPLLECWSDPQPGSILPLCLAACDFHTTRCRTGKNMEFSSDNWAYVPVEIMLLMRLRSLRGLENPQFEHPLWLPAFQRADFDAVVTLDPLIEAIESKMEADQFDAASIVRTVLKE